MANNRLYLCCGVCLDDETKTMADCLFYVAKYYPSTGWYVSRPEQPNEPHWSADARLLADFGADLNAFFDKHRHGDMFGRWLSLFRRRLRSVCAGKSRRYGLYLSRSTASARS